MSILDWTDEHSWTDEDSAALDEEILAHFPNRPPLRPDPELRELLAPLRSDMLCVDCGEPMGTGPKKETGLRQHRARGQCTTCYHRQKNGSTPAVYLMDTGLALSRQGKSIKEIAQILGVTQRTVTRWRTSDYRKGAA